MAKFSDFFAIQIDRSRKEMRATNRLHSGTMLASPRRRGGGGRARRGREPGPVATVQSGARLSLERGERDQRLAEAAVRVGEAEEVVEQALRERGPGPQPAQRFPHLRVVEQLRERDDHARDL
jgi:hypothetical protein